MSRRGYASSDIYSDHDPDYYPSHRDHDRRGGRTAEYEEIDIRESRRRAPAHGTDFLREDYGRSREAGPLVVREQSRERPRGGRREVEERDEVLVRERSRERPRRREVVEDEVIVAKGPKRAVREEEIAYRPRSREREIIPLPPQQIRSEREEFLYRSDRREREREREQLPVREPVAVPRQPIRSEREEFVFAPRIREPSPEPERTEISIRERERERPRYREERDEEIIIRRDEKSRERPRYREEHDEEIIIRRDEKSRDPPRYRDEREEEIIIRDRERERRRPRASERETLTVSSDEGRTRARSRGGFEEENIIIRRDAGPRSRAPSARGDYREEDIIIRRDERERERPRERSRSRDREDIIVRHDDNGRRHNDEIIIRRNERSPSPEPMREPEPIRAPPLHQEIITHHRHIDHGFERAPEPPRPRSPSPPPRDERIEIRHSGTRDGRHYDDDIIFERETAGRRHLEGVHRGNYRDEYAEQSSALIDTRERHGGRRYEAQEDRRDRLWTEITKDLVSEDAIKEKGYEFEETETAYFVMEHLRYDEVLHLVELTEDIRADRRDRINEMQAERENAPPRRALALPPSPWDEERVIEREIIYEGGRPPRRGYR